MKIFVRMMCMATSAMTLLLFTGCDKDDGGGSAGGFDVHVPSFVKGTTPIRVDLGVNCDKAPSVTFATEGDALGVVSPVENPEFNTDYVYADEPIDANFVNGRATATFWYIPLTPGNHAVTFTVNYTQNGAAKTGSNRKVLKVSDASNGGFYPEVINDDPGRYYFSFRNELSEFRRGCPIYLMFVDANGETDPSALDIIITQGRNKELPMERGVFYPLRFGEYSPEWGEWVESDVMLIRKYPQAPATINLIIRDDFNRCRNVRVEMDEEIKLISSTCTDYYLWPR